MVPKRIGLASRSNFVSLADLTRVAAAINLQVQRDFQPIWNLSASVVALPDPESIEPGVWPVFMVDADDPRLDGALGLHQTEHNQPYALVQSGPTWSLTASHEVLEMLADPSGNWLIPSSGIEVANGDVRDREDAKFEYLVEVADPSEGPTNAYMIDDILVTDFYTPNFFDHSASPGVRYSFSGKIKRPRQILPGGYISWLNPELRMMQQLLWLEDTPSIRDLPGVPLPSGRSTLRGFVDSHTIIPVRLSQLPATSDVVEARSQRVGYLRSASSLRSAAYTLARRPSGGPIVLPPPTAAQKVLDANKDKLQVQGATKAYVGWRFENNWITRDRAIVVLARSENVDAVRNLLPDSIRDIPIEVRRDPRPRRATETAMGMFIAADSGAVREEDAAPSFPGEVSFEAPVASALLAAKAAKPVVKYQPPKGVTLDPITADMRLILHVSPEQGWAQLSSFLNTVQDTLVIGMYEFTAPHVEQAILAVSPEKLTLTLDSPAAKGSREQTVEDTDRHLQAKLGKRLDFAWALAGLGHNAPAKAFPTSYHIKVAVKDDEAFWLSSGNFNSSNQPELDPNDLAALNDASRKNDRDWHVICECKPLAEVFRKYLKQDFDTAFKAAKAPKKAKKGKAAAALAAAAAPGTQAIFPQLEALAARPAKSFFPAHEMSGRIKVKPLLTPDDYRKPILELIKGAQRTFFMQTQYIHTVDAAHDGPAPFGGPKHMDLITALAGLIKRGVDVRIITSEYQDRSWIERLQDAGVDAVEHLRIQAHVHNKGIVVDSEKVVVSSQNWSGDGTGANRDAGLIIYNSEAAKYFEGIFLHDWVNMAAAKALR